MIHRVLARKHSLEENQEIWTKFRRCSGHDNSRTCREFRFSMRAKNRAIKFSPLENLFRKLSRCFRSRQNYRKFRTAKTFLDFVFFYLEWMTVQDGLASDSNRFDFSKKSLSLSLARWQLLNKLEVGCVFEGISVPRYRIFIHLPTYRCHRSSRPSSLRMDDEGRGKQRNGTTMFKRLAFWRPNRFDHLYLVSHRSRWKKRKEGSLIIPDIGRPIILLANLNFFFFFGESLE